MNNSNVLQSLLLMKSQFTMIDSQINNLISQIQNMGILPNTNMQINNISIQILNFGINMLNLGKQNSNPMMNYNLKEQIDNIINQLNNFTNNFSNNLMNFMYIPNIDDNLSNNSHSIHNVKFLLNNDVTMIVCNGNMTIEDLINKFLIRIGRNDLIYKDTSDEFEFLYNGYRIDTRVIKNKNVDEIIKNVFGVITVIEKRQII